MNIQLPLQLCEPMSEIQRRAEILVPGVRCLDAAAAAPPLSLERLLLVTAYAASTYACTVRTSKCVSPVLSETTDAFVPELGVRMLSELVAGDKGRARGGYMASAWVVEGGRGGWTVCGDDAPLASLRAAGLEIQAAFRSRLEFADGDVYDWAWVSFFFFFCFTFDLFSLSLLLLRGLSSPFLSFSLSPRTRAYICSRITQSMGQKSLFSLIKKRKTNEKTNKQTQATPTAVGLASGKNAVTYDGRVRIAPVLPDGDFDNDKATKNPSSSPPPSHVLHAVLDFRAPSLMAALKGGSAVSRAYSGWVERVPASQTRETTPATRERVPGVDFDGDFATHLDVVMSGGSGGSASGSGGGSGGASGSGNGGGNGVGASTSTRRRLWTTPPVIPGCRYGYTKFSAGLNDDGGGGGDKLLLPPTDSRRRRDTRLLEAGKYDEAQAQLDRILEIERRREAPAMALGEDGKLRAAWFEEIGGGIYRAAAAAAAADDDDDDEAAEDKSSAAAATSSSSRLASPAELSAFLVAEAATNSHREFKRAPLRWKFSGEYWRAREEKDWSRSPSIF